MSRDPPPVPMADVLETVLLLALPASGKSKVRRYLASVDPKVCARDFHVGPTVQLDDFPYVHAMRRVDDEVAALGKDRAFFRAPDESFRDARHWGTLVELVNEDHARLVEKKPWRPKSAAPALLDRIEAAAKKVGATGASLDPKTRAAIAPRLEDDAKRLFSDLNHGQPKSLRGKTLVIEFARGGREGAKVPLSAPCGYAYSLSLLSPAILEKAAVLYVWVTPEESRRKNAARANPADPGSILHHGVPESVMREDYGSDDVDHLESLARRPGTIPVRANGRVPVVDLPLARFDNRIDRTSFVRMDRESWEFHEIRALHNSLKDAFGRLWATRSTTVR